MQEFILPSSGLYTAQEAFYPRMNIVLMYVKYKINEKSAGNGTKL
jgi:hypothetical protein